MSIFSDTFVVYERLASAKMQALVASINGHTHDGNNGVNLSFSVLHDYILASQIPTGVNAIITGDMIVDGTIDTADIATGAITYNLLDSSTIHISADGYAVYAP